MDCQLFHRTTSRWPRLSLVNAKRERFKLTTRRAGMRCQALLSEYEEDEAGRRIVGNVSLKRREKKNVEKT